MVLQKLVLFSKNNLIYSLLSKTTIANVYGKIPLFFSKTFLKIPFFSTMIYGFCNILKVYFLNFIGVHGVP